MKVITIFNAQLVKIPHFKSPLTCKQARWPHFFYCIFLIFISWLLITPSFKKSLIVEQFQGNYLKVREGHVNTDSVMSSQPFSTNSSWRTHFLRKPGNKIYLALANKTVFFFATHFTWLPRLCHARCLPHGTSHANKTTDVRAFFSTCQWARHRNKSLALSAIFHFPSFGTCKTYSSLLTVVY